MGSRRVARAVNGVVCQALRRNRFGMAIIVTHYYPSDIGGQGRMECVYGFVVNSSAVKVLQQQ